MSARMRLLAACAAMTVLAPGLVHAAFADEGDPATGWWSRTRLGTPLEPPDTVPDGGTYVAAGPTGRLGVSALRAELAPDLRATALTLDVAESRGTVAVTVCAVAAAWTPVEGGRLEDAPPEDCTLPAQGVVEEGKLLVMLDPASPAGPLDVVLLPADGAVFTLSLQPATAASVVVEPLEELPPLPDPSGAGFGSGADGSDGSGSTETVPLDATLALPPVLDGGMATSVPPLLAGDLPALPPAAAPPPPEAPRVAPPAVALPVAPPALRAFDPRRESAPAFVLLLMLTALAMRLQAEPARAPRSLGGAARARPAGGMAVDGPAVPLVPVRGVGRFRRPRPELSSAAADPRGEQHGVGRFRRTRSEPPVRL